MQKIVILGTGGNCIDIFEAVLDINAAAGKELMQCVGFLDDNSETHGKTVCGLPVLGALARAKEIPDAMFVNGIGSDRSFLHKPEIIAKTGLLPERFKTIIHPSVSLSPSATIGAGTVILPQCVIASNARIGNHVMILPLSVISHDSVVGDFTTIAGGVCVSGNVRVGGGGYLGSNCAIRGNLEIGAKALIGMGAVVVADVPANAVMAGNPACKIRDAG